MASIPGISRLEQDASGTRGWQVRLQRRGVRIARFFSDARWGSTEAALRRAIDFRDRVLARRSETTIRVQETLTQRNQSGVVGVSRIDNLSSNGTRYTSWQATWSEPDGTRRRVRFSVLRYGEEEAFQLACEARASGIAGEWSPENRPL